MDNRPIGVFDSGLGGLTVLKEITEVLPGESVVYFGDGGRVPYGTKSKDTIVKYTLQGMRFLLNQDIKMIVIACNTASAASYDILKQNCRIPVIEVIRPGAKSGAGETRNKRVGVIGTTATINSNAYEKSIKGFDPEIQVFSKACPLFVPIAEEGREWWDSDIAYKVAEQYLLPLKDHDIDTLVLGCTHYPLLQSTISRVMGSGVSLVSSAQEAAKAVREMINSHGMMRDDDLVPVCRYYTSDSVDKFEPLCSAILDRKISSAEKVDIEKY